MGKSGSRRIHLNHGKRAQVLWAPGQRNGGTRKDPELIEQLKSCNSGTRDEIGTNLSRPFTDTLMEVVVALATEKCVGNSTHAISCLMSGKGLPQSKRPAQWGIKSQQRSVSLLQPVAHDRSGLVLGGTCKAGPDPHHLTIVLTESKPHLVGLRGAIDANQGKHH